jgi:hypothetical protein
MVTVRREYSPWVASIGTGLNSAQKFSAIDFFFCSERDGCNPAAAQDNLQLWISHRKLCSLIKSGEAATEKAMASW